MTSPLPPRLRDSRNLADLIRQNKRNARQLGVGFAGGRFPLAHPLGSTALYGDDEDDEADDQDLPAAINTDVAYATVAGQITLNLTYVPIEGTLLVFWDGDDLHPSEYVLTGQRVTFTDRHIHVGDRLHAVYWYWPSDVEVYETPQPAAWYRLNETVGNPTMADSSGGSHNGTYVAVTLQQPSLQTSDPDPAAAWNGTTSHADVAYGSWMDSPSIAGTILFKGSGTTGTGVLMARDDNGVGAARMWALCIGGVGGDRTVGRLTMITNGIFFGPEIHTAVGVNYNDGNRHMAGFSYDGTTLKLYMDGVLKLSQAATISTSGVARLSLGAAPSGSGGSEVYLYGGVLDEGKYFVGAVPTDADFAKFWTEATT